MILANSLFRHSGQNGCHKVPVFFNGGNMAAFARGVRTANGGSERHNVHVGIHGANNTTFQTCMDNLHLGFIAEEFFIDILIKL